MYINKVEQSFLMVIYFMFALCSLCDFLETPLCSLILFVMFFLLGLRIPLKWKKSKNNNPDKNEIAKINNNKPVKQIIKEIVEVLK